MGFYLIGTNYQSADIALREESYKKRKDIFNSLRESFQEAALLSTCNRVEFYGVGKKVSGLPEIPQGWHFISGKTEVFRHALRLASGLESQLKGETQILKQINAWRTGLPATLSSLWQKAYLQALDIRDQAGLNQDFYNVATILYKDLEVRNIKFVNLIVVVVGTGQIAELLAKNKPDGVNLYFVSRKNRSRAENLALSSQGYAIGYEDLTHLMHSADVLISATASPHYIFKKDQIKQAALKRKNPLYIYDLAVPRDIEPQVGNIEGVELRNLDDLALNFEEYNITIKDKLSLAEYLLEERVKIYEKSIEAGKPGKPACLTSGR